MIATKSTIFNLYDTIMNSLHKLNEKAGEIHDRNNIKRVYYLVFYYYSV